MSDGPVDRPWRDRPGGISVRVRVSPRGGRDAIEGVEAMADATRHVKVRVRCAPQDGEANDAVRRLLARMLERPASAVTLSAGATSRLKTFDIDGDAAMLSQRLADLTASRP